jgi:pimeloyl-ACP methyl ester carboxylesterase
MTADGVQAARPFKGYRRRTALANWTEETVKVAGTELVLVRGGSGRPLLMLHDELGYPGWVSWNDALAAEREFIIPLQPGFGKSPRLDWVRSYRDLGGFYARVLREMNLAPIDVIAFSAGGYIAAEMAASDPHIFSRMVLSAPMGLKPTEGEIFDFLAVTIRTCLMQTVSNPEAPDFAKIYGGEMTPEQFEWFEDARAETARLGWEPFMYNPSLGHLLEGVTQLPTLLIWGEEDAVVPRGCIDAYQNAIPSAQVVTIPRVGHRPEVEDPETFMQAVKAFLAS